MHRKSAHSSHAGSKQMLSTLTSATSSHLSKMITFTSYFYVIIFGASDHLRVNLGKTLCLYDSWVIIFDIYMIIFEYVIIFEDDHIFPR